MGQVIDFFRVQQEQHDIGAIGVASFGPVDPDPESPTFGYITNTPKPGWAHTPVVPLLREAFDLPIGFDTDVNAAALGEHRWGAAQGVDTFVYLTIGTGIGGGGMVNGNLIHGLLHPEMGHIPLPRDRQRDPSPASAPSTVTAGKGWQTARPWEARWGQPWGDAAAGSRGLAAGGPLSGSRRRQYHDDPVTPTGRDGGGVMEGGHIFPLVHQEVQAILNGYIQNAAVESAIDSYIVPPALGGRAGVLGAIALAQRASGNQ